jgi:hypothetical protein
MDSNFWSNATKTARRIIGMKTLAKFVVTDPPQARAAVVDVQLSAAVISLSDASWIGTTVGI